MKRSLSIILILLAGCSTQTISPKAEGCLYYCYPKDGLPGFVSLTRTNADGTSGAWAGGILSCKQGDHVELTCTTVICSNMPRAAVTFCQYCKTNTACFDKNMPANGYTMSWDLTNNCQVCMFAAANSVATLCPGGDQGPRGLWDFVDGKQVAVKSKK